MALFLIVIPGKFTGPRAGRVAGIPLPGGRGSSAPRNADLRPCSAVLASWMVTGVLLNGARLNSRADSKVVIALLTSVLLIAAATPLAQDNSGTCPLGIRERLCFVVGAGTFVGACG